MNIFITLAILFANAIAIALVYQFIKGLPKMEKIIFIGVSFAIMYVTALISYWISGFGIGKEVNEALKSFIIYIFVPVNVIILIPFVARKYYKWKQNEIDKSDLIKRIVIVSIVGILVLAVETVYIKEIKRDIEETGKSVKLEYTPTENSLPVEPMENRTANEEAQAREEYNNSLKIISNTISETIENNIAINEQEY